MDMATEKRGGVHQLPDRGDRRPTTMALVEVPRLLEYVLPSCRELFAPPACSDLALEKFWERPHQAHVLGFRQY